VRRFSTADFFAPLRLCVNSIAEYLNCGFHAKPQRRKEIRKVGVDSLRGYLASTFGPK